MTAIQKILRTLGAIGLLASATTLSFSRSAFEVTPLLVGSPSPKVSVTDESGVSQYLPALLKDKYSIVVFYRGGWCPYCNTQLQALGKSAAKLNEMGFQIIAISPDSPSHLKSIEKDGDLTYSLYSDNDFEAAEAFGIDFKLDKATLKRYEEYGIDLVESSDGENKDRLPVPSIFIVTPENLISFQHVDPDYRFRISEELLLAAAKDAKAFHQNPTR